MDPVTPTSPQKLSTYTPQSDPARYVRTYARDVAAVTNTPLQTPAAQSAISQAPEDSKREAAKLDVSLPEFDASPVNYKGDGVSPKEFKQEVVELSENDSDGIFQGKESPAATPLMPQGSIGIAQTITPTRSVQPAEQAPQPAPEEDRESILARLRAKVANTPQETLTPPVPTPEVPAEAPIRAAAPAFPEFTTPFPPAAPRPAEQPAPIFAPVQPPKPEAPSPIHTYSTDFADHIDTQQGSTFSVLAAQSDAGQNSSAPRKRKKSLVPLIAGGAMVLIGIGAISGAYFYVQKETTVPTVANIPSLVTFDEGVEVKGMGPALVKAITDIAQGGSVSGNVVVTYVTDASATSTVAGIPQPGAVLIKRLGLAAPDILIRNIQDTSTVGVIKAGAESRPFFVLKVNSYERTFAGMLAWEPTMTDDLDAFYPAYPSIPVQAVASTSSSTPVMLQANTAPTSFTDSVVANYDVRVLRDASGRSLILYGYVGKDILIIARDEAAFTALASRIRSTED